MDRRLENYLRTHRKQSGLTQREVAFLLGSKNGDQVSRYERRCWLPPLETAIAFEVVFKVPIAELFAGAHRGVAEEVEKRRAELRAMLAAKIASTRRAHVTHHKLRWLGVEEVPPTADRTPPTA